MPDGSGYKHCVADGYWSGHSPTCKGMFKHVDYLEQYKKGISQFSLTW